MVGSGTWRQAKRLGVVMLGVVAAAACSSVGAQPSTPTPAAPVPAGLERFYMQQLAWGSCTPFARSDDEKQAFADTALDCARMEVPLDYAAPDGRTAQIAVLRHRTHQARTGSLVLNPGGPGGAGLAFAASLANTYGGGPFDVVGFDPRGVGASTPALDCRTPAEERAERAETNIGLDAAQYEAKTRDYISKCEERSGGRDVLANVGTRDVARDLDVLRAVLGDRKLTYVGYSYGTRIGATYGEMFPGNVRAMVLDGAVDPTQNAADSLVAQMAGFQQAFDAYAADCAQKPDCPLGADPHAATAAYQALTRPLLKTPSPAADGRSLSYGDATTGTIEAMYTPRMWPALTEGLKALRAGDGAPLLALADTYYDGADDDAHTAIGCVDDDRTTDRAVAGETARRAVAAAPFLDSGIAPVAALDACGLWPVPPTSTPHLPRADGLPPTLVISTTGDPATPYAAGVTLAKALHAHLLTVEGTQHTVAGDGYSCVDRTVANYLLDLELPADGAQCTIRAGSHEGA
jgi:pimeloyl-ACP methyl ester carboxylesterase